MIIYQLGPIDDWTGWQKPSRVFRVADTVEPHAPPQHRHPDEWASLWKLVTALAPRAGWEGDIRQGPYVTVIPGADYGPSEVIVGFKQDNNGATFVASPYRLPWLEAGGAEWIEG